MSLQFFDSIYASGGAANPGMAASAPAAMEEPGTGESLHRLLVQVATGDRSAFARLYDLSAPRFFGMVLRIVRCRAEAEDIVQEGYLTIWKKALEYDRRRGSPQAWMSTIFRRRAIDHCRRRQTRNTVVTVDETLVVSAADSPLRVSDHERREMSEEIARLWPRLNEEEARALRLAYFSGKTQLEIAQCLRLPLGTVKARIRRGLFKLRPAQRRAP